MSSSYWFGPGDPGYPYESPSTHSRFSKNANSSDWLGLDDDDSYSEKPPICGLFYKDIDCASGFERDNNCFEGPTCPRSSGDHISRGQSSGFTRYEDASNYPIPCETPDAPENHLPLFRFIEIKQYSQGSTVYLHKDYWANNRSKSVSKEFEHNLPQLSDETYHEYPFVVVKTDDLRGETALQLFVYSPSLLRTLVKALHLGGSLKQHRLQDGVQLLQAWEKLRRYLLDMEYTVDSYHERLELGLLVHGFMENWTILSSIGFHACDANKSITLAHYDAIHERTFLHQELELLRDIFTRKGEKSHSGAYGEELERLVTVVHNEFILAGAAGGPEEPARQMQWDGLRGLRAVLFRFGVSMQRILPLLLKRMDEISELKVRQERLGILYQSFALESNTMVAYSRGSRANGQCKRISKHLCNTQAFWAKGIETFQHILNGGSPATLLQALSSICVSTAMASVLDQAGETSGMRDEVIADISRWRVAILHPSEKETFDEITNIIWPRSPCTNQPLCNDSNYAPHWDSFQGLAKMLVSRSRGFYHVREYSTSLQDETSRVMHTYEVPPPPNMTSPKELYGVEESTDGSIPVIEEPVLYPSDLPADANCIRQPGIPNTTPPLPISVPLILGPDSAVKLGILIMAGAIFTAIIIFSNFVGFPPLVGQQSRYFQKGLRWREIAQERLKNSLHTLKNGLFDVLRRDENLSCFDTIFEIAVVRSKGLTRFSNSVSFMQSETKLQFRESLDLLSYLLIIARELQYNCIYQVINANIRLQCAEFELYLQRISKDPDDNMPGEVFSDKNAPPEVHSNCQRAPVTDPKISSVYTTMSIPNKRKAPSQPSQEPKRQAKDKPFTCEVCDQGFCNIGNLNRHRKANHTEEAPVFRCEEPVCGKTFTRLFARDKHHRKFHPHLCQGKESDAGLPPRHLLVANGYI